MEYSVARLPTLQEEKAVHIGGGVTLCLKDNTKYNGIKVFKEKRCATEPLVTRCYSRTILTTPCLGWGLIIAM